MTWQSRVGTEAPAAPPFVGGASGQFAFEMITDDAEEFPFVALDDTGRFSRILHGRVRLGDSHTLVDVALKVQRDDYLLGGGDDAALTNAIIDEMWQREILDHREVGGDRVVSLLPVARTHESPPVIYCRHQHVYFHPPCPRTGEPLRVCRDDALLQDAGLRSYRSSLHRYLVGGAPPDKAPTTFYRRTALDDERPRSGTTVRVGAELFVDLATVAHGEVKAKTWFPCATCPERDNCYAKPSSDTHGATHLVTERLVALSYYDFAFLAMPRLPLSFDEAVRVLGGADWEDVKQHASVTGNPGRMNGLADLDRRFGTGRQWLADSTETRTFALESLRAKLTLLCDVALGLCAVHERAKRAHLGVEPRNVMVRVAEPAAGVPARWTLVAQLIDLGAARRFRPAHPSRRDVPVRYVPDGDREYCAPANRSVEGVMAPARVRVEVAPTNGGDATLSARFAPEFNWRPWQPGTLSRLMLNADTWVWAEVVQIQDGVAKLIVRTPSGASAGHLTAKREFPCHVWLHKSFGPDCDLYGFGLLFFRLLLSNDESPASRVGELVARIADRLNADASEKQSMSPQACRTALARKIHEHGEVFRESAILWRKADRVHPVEGFPEVLWFDLLMFGFRLLSDVPGFGFAKTQAAAGGSRESISDALRRELDTMLARVHTELFAAESCKRDIRALCNSMLTEVRDDLRVAADNRPTPDFPTPPERTAGPS